MKLGLNLVRVRPDRMPALAAHAERLGFESVFVPDHVVIPVGFRSEYPGTADGRFPYDPAVPLYDPWTVLAGIAAATDVIRLGTAIYLVALRHPIVTARHAVTLEALAGPRLLLGVGVGWLAEEFAALGIDPRTRFSRAEEAVAALRVLWTEPEPSYQGRHFAFERVHLEPKPASTPCPPILFGGDSDGALRRAARCGDGWISGGVAEDTEAVGALVARLREARDEVAAQRSDVAHPFHVTVLHPAPSAADLAHLAAIGVDRVVVMPWARNRDAAAAIERFRDVAAAVVEVEAPTAAAPGGSAPPT